MANDQQRSKKIYTIPSLFESAFAEKTRSVRIVAAAYSLIGSSVYALILSKVFVITILLPR